MTKLWILGSGNAGLTAAVYAARAGLEPVVVTGPVFGGLLSQTSEVENFPGFPEPVNGFELMQRMQEQALRAGAKFQENTVKSVYLQAGGPQKITFEDHTLADCPALLIAVGSRPRWLGIKGEERLKNHGVSACAMCDGPFYRGKTVCVVGGGDTAMEEALFLSSFCKEVHLIHRRDRFRASRIMTDRVSVNPAIRLHLSCTVEALRGEDKLEGLVIRNWEKNITERISTDACFLALGHIPDTAIFRGQLDMDEQGYLLLQGNSGKTFVDGIFAAGDCTDSVYRQAVTAAGSGCRAAMDAIRWLDNRRY